MHLLRRYFSLYFVCIFLAGCQATVTVDSNPPGAYISGEDNAGKFYQKNLPTELYWNLSQLPKNFPNECGMIRMPAAIWPDGVRLEAQEIKLCYKNAVYTFQKPLTNQPEYRSPYQSSLPASTTIDDARAKCRDIGFKAGTEDFGKCVLRLSK